MTSDIKIRNIQKEDYPKAIDFSLYGMHDNWYTDDPDQLLTFGKYFFYRELDEATKAYSATIDNRFVGMLLASIQGEEKIYRTEEQVDFVNKIDCLLAKKFPGTFDSYSKANEEMFSSYLRKKDANPEGEISFMDMDPTYQGKGIATLLLNALEEQEKGKELYVFTDSGCTYQFYEHRGFIKEGERKVVFPLPKGNVPLTCFLYSKKVRGDK